MHTAIAFKLISFCFSIVAYVCLKSCHRISGRLHDLNKRLKLFPKELRLKGAPFLWQQTKSKSWKSGLPFLTSSYFCRARISSSITKSANGIFLCPDLVFVFSSCVVVRPSDSPSFVVLLPSCR